MRSLSCVRLFATPWTVAYQALPSMGFSRQEYWSGVPFPSPGDLPNPGIEPGSPALQADALPSEPPGKPLQVLLQNKFLEGGLSGSKDQLKNLLPNHLSPKTLIPTVDELTFLPTSIAK